MKLKSLAVFGIVAITILVVTGAVLRAQGSAELTACATCEAPRVPRSLPPTVRGPMQRTRVGEALSVLQFDDGTCESGLGTPATLLELHEFDVPAQCNQSGLAVVGLTARVNTGIGTAFAFAQAGATPPQTWLIDTIALMTPIPALGPCPATTLSTRAIDPGAAVITDTLNFFAGLQTPTGFVGRDTNSFPAGRMWLGCPGCAMSLYSPTDLSAIGLGGNWMIRVTVEDQNCVPVELMGFDVC